MKQGLLFNQTRPIRTLSPGGLGDAQQFDLSQGFFIGHGGQFTGAEALERFGRGTISQEPLLLVANRIH